MRIESIEYEELQSGWKLCKTSFKLDVSLLVGLSGAGKTRILNAIEKIRDIAISNSKDLPGAIRWRFEFIDNLGAKCVWAGETDVNQCSDDTYNPAEIVYEFLKFDGVEVFETDRDRTVFRGNSAPPISRQLSGIRVFSIDPDLTRIGREFKDLIVLNYRQTKLPISDLVIHRDEYDEFKEKYSNLENLRSSELSLDKRIFMAFFFNPDIKDRIESEFTDSFSNIGGISCHVFTICDAKRLWMLVHEKHVYQHINLTDLSSGMLKTFLLIAYCHLWSDGTVILIDEFESSMSMNCLKEVTGLVLETGSRMQFILTSHHSYVINNIRPEHWKIVSREGGKVSTQDANDIGIGSSQHTAFTQLMNSKAYTEGIFHK